MRLYEVVYILDPALLEDAVTAKLEKFHSLATSQGGEVNAVDHWGVRQLAYPIKKLGSGYYVVAQFTAATDALPEFERLLKLDDEVIRYLLVLNEGEPTTGKSIMAEEPPHAEGEREADDDDDDDRDEDEDDPDKSPPEFHGARGRRRRMEGPRITLLNYKDVSTLSRFVTEQGKILPKRTTKVTAAFQRQLGSAVKRARFLSLLPYTGGREG
ncbi:MAG TPA: 30S ribosomal protein S6 [Longimicrobiales bacterium]|nr:30S ribosomal protein S6 [Longimicrobiales bacterium]